MLLSDRAYYYFVWVKTQVCQSHPNTNPSADETLPMYTHGSTPTKWVIAFFTLGAGGFRDRQCGGEQKRSLCLPEGEKTLCQKGISAPPSIQPGLGETSELLGPRPEVKQRASCPTAFALLTPSSAHPYRASVISGFNKKEPDYKGLHESNKII